MATRLSNRTGRGWKAAWRGGMVAALATLLVAGTAACGATGTSTASAAKANTSVRTITAVSAGAPAPFITKQSDGSLDGQNIELTKAIFAKLPQYKLVWKTADFSAIYPGLDAGRYQMGVNNFSKTSKNKDKYLFSDPLYSAPYVAVVRKDDALNKVSTFADLAGKRIIVPPAGLYNIVSSLEAYNKKNPSKASKIVYSQAEEADAIRQVENGTGDVYFLDGPSYYYLKDKAGIDVKRIDIGDEVESKFSADSHAYLIFSKDQKQLRDDVNKALKQVIKDGTAATISKKWFGEDLTTASSD